jgi:hypothetical protein
VKPADVVRLSELTYEDHFLAGLGTADRIGRSEDNRSLRGARRSGNPGRERLVPELRVE